jgi:hypothetical protein
VETGGVTGEGGTTPGLLIEDGVVPGATGKSEGVGNPLARSSLAGAGGNEGAWAGGVAGEGGIGSEGLTEGGEYTGGEGGNAATGGRVGVKAGFFSWKRNRWAAIAAAPIRRTTKRMIRRRFCRPFERDEAPVSPESSARFSFFMRPPGKRDMRKEKIEAVI